MYRCISFRFRAPCILVSLSVSCLYIANISTGNPPERSAGGDSMSLFYAGVRQKSMNKELTC